MQASSFLTDQENAITKLCQLAYQKQSRAPATELCRLICFTEKAHLIWKMSFGCTGKQSNQSTVKSMNPRPLSVKEKEGERGKRHTSQLSFIGKETKYSSSPRKCQNKEQPKSSQRIKFEGFKLCIPGTRSNQEKKQSFKIVFLRFYHKIA